ncbi:uroporphyrinogen-III synthase [Croceicoccus sp. F390]|uniref:Uroporphyrinogen-III synthase n=1 Tax=Croceicoccus esteveae TaxID=3075597 RepID=A0ABU2ZHV1_9SPHN|nr:uroporphyrinogen-III synthase [Croceicoccus sp. F390]MDT0576188.1 uroporphyrinogen-III synthase [Croceicoccus sp. F390]
MRPLITIRPAPGDAQTVALGQSMGLPIVSHPLFSVEPLAWTVPDPALYDAILIGSANVLRHAGQGLAALRHLPAYCVGHMTASVARSAGFAVAFTGAGNLQSVLAPAMRAGHRRLLRLCGEAHVPVSFAPGTPDAPIIDRRMVYRVIDHPLGPALAKALMHQPVVLLHSGEAARHFSAEVDRISGAPGRNNIALACLAPRIAAAAGTGWRKVAIADTIDDGALLALAGQMCQMSSGPED